MAPLSGELELVPLRMEDFLETLLLKRLHGPLAIDSINLAVDRRLGITEIVTANGNFDPVPGVIVYKPQDNIA